MRFSAFVAAAVLLTASVAAHAATITYTETVTASGSLNNVSFSNALLTLQATADTNAVTGSSLYTVPTLTFGGTVAGLGSFTLPTGTVFANQSNAIDGFSTGTLGDILDVQNSFFSTYNLKTATALITGGALSSMQAYPTIGSGKLQINSIGASATFQAALAAPPAAVTPEPSSFALLGTGVLGIAGVLRKRFA